MKQFGFTLIELLVTIAIAGILLALAAPAFTSAILGNRLTTYANTFMSGSQLARSEAIKRNVVVTLCRSSDGATCATSGTWQQGWIVVCKYKPAVPGVCVSDGTDDLVLSRQQRLPDDYRFSGNAYALAFDATGGAGTQALLVLCRALPSPGNQEREIRISSTGRASVSTTRSGNCS